MNKETLEEAFEKSWLESKFSKYSEPKIVGKNFFIDGAKYQAEKMYTEEDMIEFGFNTYHYISELMGWPFRQVSENKLHVMYNLEQYKKK